MLLRERPIDREQAPRGAGPAHDGGALEALRQSAERFHAAGDDAISRALSGNAEAFLAATRQQGGE